MTITKILADPADVIIPILVSIPVFPVLVIITICSIRMRNIRAREKRIKSWAKKSKISKGMVNTKEIQIFKVTISAASSSTSKPKVRFAIHDVELGTVMTVEAADAVVDDDGHNQCKIFSDKPSNNRKRNTQNIRKSNVEQAVETEDSIRKEMS